MAIVIKRNSNANAKYIFITQDGYGDADCSLKISEPKRNLTKEAEMRRSRRRRRQNRTITNATKHANKTTNATKKSNATLNASSIARRRAARKTERKEEYVYFIGKGGVLYLKTEDCDRNCTGKGVCLNSTCFCNQGYASKDCSMTYKEYNNRGIELSKIWKWSVYTFITTTVLALGIMIVIKTQ